jgi:hypothetical protein
MLRAYNMLGEGSMLGWGILCAAYKQFVNTRID